MIEFNYHKNITKGYSIIFEHLYYTRILNYVIFKLQEHYDDGYDDVHGNVQFFAMNK